MSERGCERCKALANQVRRVHRLSRIAAKARAEHNQALSAWAAAEANAEKAMTREACELAQQAWEEGLRKEALYHEEMAGLQAEEVALIDMVREAEESSRG